MPRFRLALARCSSWLLVAAALTGCGDESAGFEHWLRLRDPQPLAHASLPQLQTFGGPVLTSPKVVPIFFEGDPYQADVERFLLELRGSPYWTATTSEYGVGDLEVLESLVVSEPPPETMGTDDVGGWLAAHLDASPKEWPQPESTMYVVFYRSTMIETDVGAFTYYFEGSSEGGSFTYVVISEWPETDGLDGVTEKLSRELVGAAQNPFWVSNPAYNGLSPDHLAWALSTDAAGSPTLTLDYCHWEQGPVRRRARLVGEFSVERLWSNAAAATNHDPCVPADDGGYFNAAPDLIETVVMPWDGGTDETKGIRVPLNESRLVDVRLFSTASRPDWHVSIEEILQNTDAAPTLEFSWEEHDGNDGAVLYLRITRLQDGLLGGTQIRIHSSNEPDDRATSNAWMGFVAN